MREEIMLDPNDVRVDLLKFRQKAYLSYQEGSSERKRFLKAILQNELALAQQDIPPEVLNLIVDGQKIVFKRSLKYAILWVAMGIILSCITAVFAKYSLVAFLLIAPASFCMFQAGQYIMEYLAYKHHLAVVKKYSGDIKRQINRISNDIKRLDGPNGF